MPKISRKILEPLKRVPTLRDSAYEALQNAIIEGKLNSGDRVSERDIAMQLGISRTPIKEAIRRLEQEGIIVNGCITKRPTTEEIYLTRATLHGLSARLAAGKITAEALQDIQSNIRQTEAIIEHAPPMDLYQLFRQFHILVFSAANNIFLFKFQISIGPFIRKTRLKALQDKDQAHRGLAAHTEIMRALAENDPDRAEFMMRSHILQSAAFVLGNHPLFQ